MRRESQRRALLLAFFAAAGFAVGMTGPSRDLIVRQATPAGASGRVYGFVYSGIDLGAMLGPVWFGFMLDHALGRQMFFVVAALFVARDRDGDAGPPHDGAARGLSLPTRRPDTGWKSSSTRSIRRTGARSALRWRKWRFLTRCESSTCASASNSTPNSCRSARAARFRRSSIPTAPAGSRVSVFESGAILIYLGEKTGKFWPCDLARRIPVLEWLMFQMGNFGPIPGQVHHFVAVENEADRRYGLERYSVETRRLYAVMNGRLAEREFFADEVSIADFAILGWAWRHPRHKVDLADYPNVRRWYDAMMARPAVRRGFEVKLS